MTGMEGYYAAILLYHPTQVPYSRSKPNSICYKSTFKATANVPRVDGNPTCLPILLTSHECR